MLHDETLTASPQVPSGLNPAREPQPRATAPLDAEMSEEAQRHLLNEIHRRIADALERRGAQREPTERAIRERAMVAVEQWHPLRFDGERRRDRVRQARTAMNRSIEPMRTLLLLGDDPAIAEVLARWPGLGEALRGIPDDDARTAWWLSLDARLKADDGKARAWFADNRAECDAAALCAMHDAAEPAQPLLPPDDARARELVRCVQEMLSRATTIDAAGVVSIHPEHLVGNRLDVLLRTPLHVGELIERVLPLEGSVVAASWEERLRDVWRSGRWFIDKAGDEDMMEALRQASCVKKHGESALRKRSVSGANEYPVLDVANRRRFSKFRDKILDAAWKECAPIGEPARRTVY